MKKILFTFFVSLFVTSYSQVVTSDTLSPKPKVLDSLSLKNKSVVSVEETIEKVNAPIKLKPAKLNPTKAGLYSAVLPGLGQVYNKKYWKVPIVWGAVGTGAGIAIWNQNQYKKYREYYIAKLNGIPNDFLTRNPNLDKVALGNAQDRMKRQRDYAIAITGLIY
ncbi:MAG: hypothetical protein KBS61_08795, partial [Chryseobacterium sp.]|nr:hypothetical protein [Candidatus Chryseobacterium enterohippi]